MTAALIGREKIMPSKNAAAAAFIVLLLSLIAPDIAPGQQRILFDSVINSDPTVKSSLGDPEAETALAQLGRLSLPAVRERLIRLRPSAYSPAPFIISRIVESRQLPVVAGRRVDRLKAALRPVLAYHHRENMPIIVVRSEYPRASLWERAVIILTTKMMLINSEEEIRGIIAHELAHEYVWDECRKAQLANDGSAMREYELFCDAVAVATLIEIGDDPYSYAKALERMTYIGMEIGSATRSRSRTHPALHTRLKLVRLLSERFGQE